MPPSIAIIGAGLSGLAAALTLRDSGLRVLLYEKNRDSGGRAATYKQAGFIYDHGAQYIKGNHALITERFNSPELIGISKPVWTFSGQGQIQEGDPVQNAEARWSYRHGLAVLPTLMAADLDIRYETPVHHVQQLSSGWKLFDVASQALGTYEHLLITIPAQQAHELIQASQLEANLQQYVLTQLNQAHHNPLISVVLGYRPRPQTRPYYALVNTDKAHALSWLAWEHEKAPERAPADAGLLIAQMAPQYSLDHMQTTNEKILQDVTIQVATLIQEQLPLPFFSDVQRWHYALPAAKADANALNANTFPVGLAFCGDSFVGGRLHLALEHGVTVAEQLISH